MTSILVGPFPAPAWPDGIALRPLVDADAREIHALLMVCYANGFGSVPPLGEWWQAMTTDSEFDPSLVLIAVHGTRIVGFALVWNSAFIKDIVVHPDWRRRGLGSAMLAEIAHRLDARGFPSMSLKVSAANVAARKVYAQAGFREDG